MRSFRSDGINLRDVRIAYTFLFAVSAVCTILGIVVTHLDSRLEEKTLAGRYDTLIACADSLEAWGDAGTDEERLMAAVRFRSAVAALPEGVDIKPMLTLAEEMGDGNAKLLHVNALADTFSLLSSLDYPDEETADALIRDALAEINAAAVTETQQEEAPVSTPDTMQYSLETARRAIGRLFGGNAGTLDCEMTEEGVWMAEADNLRITFSAFDGSLEGFVYIRLGAAPNVELSLVGQLEAAERFLGVQQRKNVKIDARAAGELYGFTIAEIDCGGELYRAAVDRYGRVWSCMKVKR